VHVAECLEGSSQGLSSKGAVVTVRNERGGRGVPKASNALTDKTCQPSGAKAQRRVSVRF